MAEIQVEPDGDGVFRVEVREGASRSLHRVTVKPEVAQRYGGDASLETLLKRSFEFLLEREAKESILSSFELSVIERYFPEYPREIRRRLA